MVRFTINSTYKNNTSLISEAEINEAINIANRLIFEYKNNLDKISFDIIGIGNDAQGKVYNLSNTKCCLKVSKLGKHVGIEQEKQFDLMDKCRDAIKGQSVIIEGEKYILDCIPTIGVAVDEENAYSLMIRRDNIVRMWDEPYSL